MLTTRQATDRDLAFLANVFLRAMRVHITAARGFWDESKERSQFQQQLRLESTRIIVRNGVDVGFFMTAATGQEVEFHTICVTPDHQRRGIGTTITRQVIDEAQSQKHAVVLSVLKANTAARHLYERLGFVMTGESSHHYRMRLAPPHEAVDAPVIPVD
jgi:ribosomal protein S18 acetylase RimI-like enzyme